MSEDDDAGGFPENHTGESVVTKREAASMRSLTASLTAVSEVREGARETGDGPTRPTVGSVDDVKLARGPGKGSTVVTRLA